MFRAIESEDAVCSRDDSVLTKSHLLPDEDSCFGCSLVTGFDSFLFFDEQTAADRSGTAPLTN